MKKLGMTLMLAAILALAAIGSAAARSTSGGGSSATAVHGGSHGGSGHGSDDSGRGDDNGGQREPGEDIRGNCDEAEHAADANCLGAATGANAAGTSSSSSSASTAGSGPSAVTRGAKLVATVGPGYTITLKTSAGAPVKTLRAGTYTIVARDRSADHNIHLTGRGVNKETPEAATVTSTWRVRFVSGTYTFQCDPHADMMRGSLRVA